MLDDVWGRFSQRNILASLRSLGSRWNTGSWRGMAGTCAWIKNCADARRAVATGKEKVEDVDPSSPELGSPEA